MRIVSPIYIAIILPFMLFVGCASTSIMDLTSPGTNLTDNGRQYVTPVVLERELKYIIDQRKQFRDKPLEIQLFGDRIYDWHFLINPVQILDAEIELSYRDVALQSPMTIDYFYVVNVPRKSTKQGLAAGTAAVSWGAASALHDKASKDIDYIYCEVIGKVNGEEFKVYLEKQYDYEIYKSVWGSENFTSTIRSLTNSCIIKTKEQYENLM